MRKLKSKLEIMLGNIPAKNPHPRCLKITEKVALNIAREASYVYILSKQKFIKKAKNGPI